MTSKSFPLVTIAIPTYNRAGSYLKQSLSSAINQTYENIEIIVSDNCSTDNTEMVIKNVSDPRIRYFRQGKNIGANNNFNFCLRQAKGDYFLLLQDDDLIDCDFIETCVKSVNYEIDKGIIRTGTRVIDSHGNVLNEVPNQVGGLSTEDFFRGWFAGETTLYLCSTLFNRRRLIEIGGFKSRHNLFQDVIAEVRLAARFGRADVRDVKASFRRHHGEMTFAAKVSDWCEDSLMLLDLMCELASEHGEQIKREGMRFFSNLNYNRVRAVKSPAGRFIAYITVFKKFNYRYLPPKDHFLSPVYELLGDTFPYKGLRFIKRKIKKALANS